MRFMVIYPATQDSEQEGALPDPQLMADMNKFIDELIKAGVLLPTMASTPLPKVLAFTSQARTAPSPTVPSPKPRNSSLAS
jgi:hypothetical protein